MPGDEHRLRFKRGRLVHISCALIDWPASDWDGNPVPGDLSLEWWDEHAMCGTDGDWSGLVAESVDCARCLREANRLVRELAVIERNAATTRATLLEALGGS